MDRLELLKSRYQKLQGEREALQREEQKFIQKSKDKEEEGGLCEKAAMVLIEMTKVLSAAGEEKTEKLLSMGLNSVFNDQPEFKVILESTRRRGVSNVDIFLEQEGRKHEPTDSGGGVLAILSLLLQSIVVVRSKLTRVLFLDEKLVHVSPEYRPQCLDLLRRLCEDAKFEILMTTNQDDFLYGGENRADLILSVVKKGGKLVVENKEKPREKLKSVPSVV